MAKTSDPVRGRAFRDATDVRTVGSGRFVGEVDPEWTIDGKPNGGYLLAMMARASTSGSAHDHVVAASAHFLQSPVPGPIVVEVEVLRAGRSASQSRVRMTQDGTGCVEALFTSSHLEETAIPRWWRWLPEDVPPPIEMGEQLSPTLPDGRSVAILRQVDLRLDPDTAGFTRGQPQGRGELRGWLTLSDGESFDATALLYAVDALPPASFDVEFSGWVPTIELTAYVRALPVPGPVRVLQRAQLVDAGRLDEVCYVWDRTGRLVAQGAQLAGIRFP